MADTGADTCGEQCAEATGDALPSESISIEPTDSSYVSEFIVSKMDCPSEERMIRLSMDSIKPRVALEFDIPNRSVKPRDPPGTGEPKTQRRP